MEAPGPGLGQLDTLRVASNTEDCRLEKAGYAGVGGGTGEALGSETTSETV